VGDNSGTKAFRAKIINTPKNLPVPTPISGVTRGLRKGGGEPWLKGRQ